MIDKHNGTLKTFDTFSFIFFEPFKISNSTTFHIKFSL